jgi:hypothetical protein
MEFMAEFTVSDKAFRKDLKKVRRYLDGKFPKQVLKEFKANTPVDSGNARRKTKLRNRFNGKEVVADYPYSQVLDKGEFPNPPKKGTGKTRNGYSTQAPDGMVKPTLKEAEKLFSRFLRRL